MIPTASTRDRKEFNPKIKNMERYTLRETDVNPAAERAAKMCLPVIEGRLGDATAFGLSRPKRLAELFRESCEKNLGYAPARGLLSLREELAERHSEYGVDPDHIFVGAGISGVVRSIFDVLLVEGDEVAIPEYSYIVYLAESTRMGATIRNICLEDDGQIDVDHLKSKISENTKVVVLTTVGNPLGVAVRENVFTEVIRIINEKEREFGHPIYLIADTIYEKLRAKTTPLDPIAISCREGRVGPTIHVNSLSKLYVSPGERLGWAKVAWGNDFKDQQEQFLRFMVNVMQPTLGQVPTRIQWAFAQYLMERRTNQSAREEHERFIQDMSDEVHRRVLAFVNELVEIPGIVFPRYYNAKNGSGYDFEPVHESYYTLWGPDHALRRRGNLSLARELADFLIKKQMTVLLGTPGDSFLEEGLRGRGQEYMRVVALFDDEKRAKAIEGIAAYMESLRK